MRVPGGKTGMNASGAQVVAVTPDGKTDFANVTLHVLQVPALGYKVVWVGGAKRVGEKEESGAEAKDSGSAITLENAILRVVGRQADRLYHQPV